MKHSAKLSGLALLAGAAWALTLCFNVLPPAALVDAGYEAQCEANVDRARARYEFRGQDRLSPLFSSAIKRVPGVSDSVPNPTADAIGAHLEMPQAAEDNASAIATGGSVAVLPSAMLTDEGVSDTGRGEDAVVAPHRAGYGPAVGRPLRIPAPVDYAHGLSETVAQAWVRFQGRYPGVDPTDADSFQETLMTEREGYGLHWSRADREAYAAWLAEAEAMSRDMVQARGRFLDIPLNGIDETGRGYALVGFNGAAPVYTFTQNRAAAVSTAADFVRRQAAFDPGFGPNIDGSGYYVTVNDHGSIYWNTEFRNDADTDWRLTEIRKNDYGLRDHTTHVAGTIGARGHTASAMGMAPAVRVYMLIQQYNADVLNYGMNWPGRAARSIVGNTSMGSEDEGLSGVYTSTTRSFDQALYDTPYYLHFYSAGNYGASYFTLGSHQKAGKNLMTVAAVDDATRDADGVLSGGGGIAVWSSRGPARDGRIKPDIAANGMDLYSPISTTGYGNRSGTSMASPNAAGSAVLLQDCFGKLFPGHLMRASTLKTLMIHTADDLGNPGPDYTYGWGLVNVLEGGRLVQAYAGDPASRVLAEDVLIQGQTVAIPYETVGAGPIRVTLGWTDPPGATQSDNAATAPALVNDLNARLIGPDGTVHMPYAMPYVMGTETKPPFDSSLLDAHAVPGVNFTDNTIQVHVPAPVAGEYMLEISHAGSLAAGAQNYSLAVSGLRSIVPSVPPTIVSHPTLGDNADFFTFETTGVGFMLGADLILRRDGSEPAVGYGTETTGNRLLARLDTAALAKGYWDVVVRNPDKQETVVTNGFLLPPFGGGLGPQTIRAHTFSNAVGLTLTGDWEVGSPEQSAVGGPGSAFAGDHVLGTCLTGNYENNINIYATLPPFSTINKENVTLSFRRWLGLAFDRTGVPTSQHVDYARIHYSLNGATWHQVWTASEAMNETAWGLQTYLLPSAANDRAAVYLRFQLHTDDAHVSYGWNIDDLKVTGENITVLYPPIFETRPSLTAVAGAAYAYVAEVSDEDTALADLALTSEAMPAWLTFERVGAGTARLTGTPQAEHVGTHPVSLKVADADYETWQNFEIRVVAEDFMLNHVLEVRSAHGATLTPPVGLQTNSHGATFVLAAVSPETIGTTQYVCVGWVMTGHEPASGTANSFEMTVTNNAVLTWQWNTRYWLDTAADGSGSVNVASRWLTSRTPVDIEPSADAYWHFTRWTVNEEAVYGPELVLTMDGPKSVRAHFEANLTLNTGTPEHWLASYMDEDDTDYESAALRDLLGKGMALWEDYIAGTDPENPDDVFAVDGLTATASGTFEISFLGRSNRLYRVEYKAPLTAPTWETLAENMSGSNTVIVVEDTDSDHGGLRFYRIRVSLP